MEQGSERKKVVLGAFGEAGDRQVGAGSLIGHPGSTGSMAWVGYPGSLSTGPALRQSTACP